MEFLQTLLGHVPVVGEDPQTLVVGAADEFLDDIGAERFPAGPPGILVPGLGVPGEGVGAQRLEARGGAGELRRVVPPAESQPGMPMHSVRGEPGRQGPGVASRCVPESTLAICGGIPAPPGRWERSRSSTPEPGPRDPSAHSGQHGWAVSTRARMISHADRPVNGWMLPSQAAARLTEQERDARVAVPSGPASVRAAWFAVLS